MVGRATSLNGYKPQTNQRPGGLRGRGVQLAALVLSVATEEAHVPAPPLSLHLTGP